MDPTDDLYTYLEKQQVSRVQEALKKGAAVNGKSKGLRTPLHKAAAKGFLAGVKLLISHGANVNPESFLDKGMLPLHMAVKNGFTEVVRELIAGGAKCNNRFGRGIHAVHLAAEKGHVQILELLKAEGCDLESQTREGNTPLHLAALCDNFEAVKWLVEVGGLDIQKKNQDCMSPEDCAKQKNARQSMAFLQQIRQNREAGREDEAVSNSGAQQQPCPKVDPSSPSTPQTNDTKPQSKENKDKNKDKPHLSPHKAEGNDRKGTGTKPQNIDTKSPGIKNKDKNKDQKKDKPQLPPIKIEDNNMTARGEEGNKEESIIHKLFSPLLSPAGFNKNFGGSGSDNSDVDSGIREEIVSAVTNGSYADVDRLLSLGVSTEECSQQEEERGLRLLHLAAWNGHTHVVRLLLQAGANKRSKAHGLLAVHWASIGGHVDVLEELWNQGLSIKARADDYSTPLHFAADHGNKEAVLWLTEKGAFLQVKDKKGRTPRDLAVEAGNQAVAAILKEKEEELRMDNMTEIKKLGEGSFGEAYLMKKGGKHIVVKHIDLSMLTRPQQKYAHAEIKVLKSLCHPNIVSYKGGGFETRYLYIHMEYCSGGDLAAMISKHRERKSSFNKKQVYVFTLRLCFALKYIHRRKILHRDIKPANIFLDEFGVVKLGDFGLVRVLEEGSTMANTILGTPAYMSPEVINGTPYDAKSDMWSFGCCLYEVATLKPPQPLWQVKEVIGPLPDEYKQAVLSLLHTDPKERFSAEDLLKETFLVDTMELLLETSEQDVKSLSKDVQDLTEELTETARELEGIRGKKGTAEVKPR